MWFSMLRATFWLGLGLLVGFLGPYAWVVDRRVAEDFAALQWQVPTLVMARPLRLQPGMPLDIPMLRAELQASAYHEDDEGADLMGQLRFVEMLLDRLVDDVRDTAIGDQRDGFGPLECSALARGLQQRLAPGVQEIDARLGLAARTGIAGKEKTVFQERAGFRGHHAERQDKNGSKNFA